MVSFAKLHPDSESTLTQPAQITVYRSMYMVKYMYFFNQEADYTT